MDIDGYAKLIWDYMLLGQEPVKSEAIFVLGNRDIRTAKYAAELFMQGFGQWLIISGGVTHSNWNETEADKFARIAQEVGVPKAKLLIEDRALNTGQNITFTANLLARQRRRFGSLLIVQKPYMERRTYAALLKQWLDSTTKFTVVSPPIGYADYFDANNPKVEGINIMVGDLQRLREYPKLGFQVEQIIPSEVWRAYESLVKLGYDKHLIKG